MYECEEVECAECGAVFPVEDYQYHMCDTPAANHQEIATRQIPEEINVAKLAEAVQARPALWDHTLPLKERGKDIREKMWREVYEEIDRMIPLDIIEKKWKNLKDTFLKHLKTYKPSGGGVDEKKKWKHFECMYFLANVNSNRKTFGNFEMVETEVDLSAPSTSKTPDLLTPKTSKIESKTVINSPDITTSRNKRQRKRDQSDQLLMEILQQPAPTSHAAPAISPALMAVQEVLNKMPQRIRMEAEIDFLNRVYQLYAEHS